MRGTGRPSEPVLWSTRYLVGGQLWITRTPKPSTWSPAVLALVSFGRTWRSLPQGMSWFAAIFIAVMVQIGLGGPAGVVVLLMLGLLILPSLMIDADQWYDSTNSSEAELAATDSPEARVASAACRAWQETLAESSWSSPHLASARASFDGGREVDAIIDVAVRIHAARKALGAQPPPGPAGDYWQQQSESLNRSAMRLGERADALIQHRDQAAALSAALVQLAELGRLERSALWVDDIALETSAAAVDPAVLPMSDQVAATRRAVNELVEMMVRTRAPLVEDPPPLRP